MPSDGNAAGGNGGAFESGANNSQGSHKSRATHDQASIVKETLTLLLDDDSVAELRVLHTKQATVSGYFNSVDDLAKNAAQWSGRAPGVYVTLNPVRSDLLARSVNRTISYARHTTADPDILRRCWLPLDFDPVRPAGVSSTNAEHEAALKRAEDCRVWLSSADWPEPIVADSGNGAHLLYRVDLPNDDESRELVQRCLDAIGFRFSDEVITVDLKTANAARIWKVYGTLAAKGDSTTERPHRVARLLDVPEEVLVVLRHQLESLSGTVPEPQPSSSRERNGRETFHLTSWIAEHGLPVVSSGPWNGATKWIISPCPWNSDHRDRAAYLVQFPNGAISAGCHHNGCAGKGWAELRSLYEPMDGLVNLSSNNREPGLEVRFQREVNAGELQTKGREPGCAVVPFFSFLGQDGYIVRGWSHILAGYPKVGKTALVTQLLAEWKDESILLITEEPESIWRLRLANSPDSFDHVTIYFGLGASSPELLSRIEMGTETVVIIDTVRNLLGITQENDSSEVARAMIPYVASARPEAKTLVFLHHDRKGGGEHGEGIAGAHAFLGVVDVALEIVRDGSAKRRRLVRGWARIIEVQEMIYEMSEDGQLVALGDPQELGLKETTRRAEALLTPDWQTTSEILDRFPNPKPSDEQLRQALASLATSGIGERDPPLTDGARRGKTYRWRSNPSSNDSSIGLEVRLDGGERGGHLVQALLEAGGELLCACGGAVHEYTPNGRTVCSHHATPTALCWACGGGVWWAQADGGWECSRCHPVPSESTVLERVEVG